MKKYLTILASLLLFNHTYGQAIGDVRNSYYSGTGVIFNTGTWSGTGTQVLFKSSGTPTSAVLGTTMALASGTLSVNTGTGSTQIPTNSNLGSAAFVNTGTASNQIPLSGNLGSLAFQSGSFTGTTSGLHSGTSSGLNTGDQTAASIGAIATLNGTGTNTSFTGSMTLNLTASGTYPPLVIRQNAGGGALSEVNESHFIVNSPGNVIVMQNTNTSGVSAVTFDQPGTALEIGAVGCGGNTGLRSLFIEASNIDVDGTTSATPFSFLQTTSYSGSTAFGQHTRFLFDSVGTFQLFPRASGVAAITMTGSDTSINISSACPNLSISTFQSNIFTDVTSSGNVDSAKFQFTWTSTASTSTPTHTAINAIMATSGTSNITGGGGVWGVRSLTGIQAGSGSLQNSLSFLGQIQNAGSGTIPNAVGLYLSAPTGGGPITTIQGVYIESLKASGVGTAYGIRQTGTADLNSFAGTLDMATAGKTLSIKSGSNAMAGTVTLTAGAGSVVSTAITTNTVIQTSAKTPSGAATPIQVQVFSGSATFAGAATDAGVYNWCAFLVAP